MNKSIKGFFLSFSSVISDKSPYPLKENFLKPHGWRTWLIFWGLLVITVATTFLAGGFMFSISLLFILGTHEFGHYWASRKNHVRASLPFFNPAPPVFIAGTFGAFILIKDPIPNRRVLMEIGAAGPIAGFLVAVPTLIVGLYLSKIEPFQGIIGVSYGNSILLAILSKLILGVNPSATLTRFSWFFVW